MRCFTLIVGVFELLVWRAKYCDVNRLTRVSGGTTTVYAWDAVNRMVEVGPSNGARQSYKYRADGMRVRAENDQQASPWVRRTYYDGQMPVEDDLHAQGNSGLVVTKNFVGARGIEMMEEKVGTSAPTQAYPLYDTHGNMVSTLSKNSAGTSWSLGHERSYDVWGSVRSGLATGGPKGRYVANLGHVQDDESGLIYMRARYYEPESGRFVSEDRVMDGSNWYVYCKNAPTIFVDESGNSPTVYINMLLFTAGFIIGHIVGVTVAVLLLMRNNPDYVVQNTVVRNLFFIGLEILTFLAALTVPGAKGEFGFADKSLKDITKTIVNSVRQTGWGRHGLAAGLGFMFGVMFGVLNAMYDAFLWEMENE